MNEWPKLGTRSYQRNVRIWVVSPLVSNATKVRYLRI